MFVVGSEMLIDLNVLNDEDQNCATHGVVEVGAGEHTAVVRFEDLESTTGLGNGTLSVLFVPFDGAGDPSTLASGTVLGTAESGRTER
jgi:hypothetical protein